MQPLFVCLDYPRHYVHLFCHEGFVSVVYVFGGLVFHLAYEHSGGFYIRSLFRVAVGVASPVAAFGFRPVGTAALVVVVGVHELMAEGAAFLEIQHGLIDNDEVLGFIVEAA